MGTLLLAQTPSQDPWHVTTIRVGSVEPPVVYSRDITIPSPPSVRATGLAFLEASGVVWVDGALLLSSDKHEDVLFICPFDPQTLEVGEIEPITVVYSDHYRVEDMEALTVRRDADGQMWVYAMSSLSNAPDARALPRRRHLLRMRLNRQSENKWQPFESTVADASPLRERLQKVFSGIGIEPYHTYYAEHLNPDKNTYRWGNFEGIAFIPGKAQQQMLCGMRNPLYGGKALVCVVEAVDALFDSFEGGLVLRDVFALDLGGRGISDICWDPVTRGYLIAALKSSGPKLDDDRPFPPHRLDSALFWWSGHKADAPIRFAETPDMKVEGICRIGDTRLIAIVSDEADISEGRPGSHQSVLTVLDFTGLTQAGPVATEVKR